ncbi:hypothetical protein PNE40_13795, partial [[Eubacterium] rectale]|uniref:hypothetical protein n=1 Tax=Agathobacter rectalis TaxID=39491 RepID=UPI0027D2CABD
ENKNTSSDGNKKDSSKASSVFSDFSGSRPASYLSKSSSLLGNGSKRYLFAFFFALNKCFQCY